MVNGPLTGVARYYHKRLCDQRTRFLKPEDFFHSFGGLNFRVERIKFFSVCLNSAGAEFKSRQKPAGKKDLPKKENED